MQRSKGRPSAREEAHHNRWRESISVAKTLAILEKVDDKLISDYKVIDSSEVMALRLLCDNQFRKLAKILPDLKGIELKGELTVSSFALKAAPK